MNEQRSSTGATAHGDGDSVAELIERAFHYRGDVTVQTEDGSSMTGYLFNRNARVSEPFVQLFETGTGREVSVAYRSITQVLFTGRDAVTASVRHFEAFQDQQGGRHGN